MHIQVSTDSHIQGREALIQEVEVGVASTLERFADQITRVEVHLSDLNADKAGATDKRCLMEARLAGRKPVAVSHEASTVDDAVDGAADKMLRSLESSLGKLSGHKGHTSFGGDQTI